MVKKYVIALTAHERQSLLRRCSFKQAPKHERQYARILLLADTEQPGQPATDEAIRAALGVSLSTVARVRRRCFEEGIPSALRRRTAGGKRPPVLAAQIKYLLELKNSAPPQGHPRWTLRLLAEEMVKRGCTAEISHETVRQVLMQAGKRTPAK